MSRSWKYLCSADKFNYFLDHFNGKIYSVFPQGFKKYFDHIPFNSEGLYFAKDCPLKHTTIRRRKDVYVLNSRFSFEFNRELKNYYSTSLDKFRHPVVFCERDNVLYPELRKQLSENGIGIPEIRKQGFQLFDEHLTVIRKQFLDYAVELGIPFTDYNIRTAVHSIEVCHDVITPPGEDLSRSKTIRRRFRNETIEWHQKQRSSDGSYCTIGDSIESGGEKQPFELNGFYTDGSRGKLYSKCEDTAGRVNRFERRFNLKSLKKLGLGTSFIDTKCLRKKAHKLGLILFEPHYRILGVEPSYDTEKRMLLFQRCCRRLCRWHSDDVFREIKIRGCIHTGRFSQTPRAVGDLARRLSNAGKLFRRKEGRRGIYVPDWNWIMKRP